MPFPRKRVKPAVGRVKAVELSFHRQEGYRGKKYDPEVLDLCSGPVCPSLGAWAGHWSLCALLRPGPPVLTSAVVSEPWAEKENSSKFWKERAPVEIHVFKSFKGNHVRASSPLAVQAVCAQVCTYKTSISKPHWQWILVCFY